MYTIRKRFMYQYVCRYSDVIQFLLKRIKSTIFVTDMKMGMNKVPVRNRNGYGTELFCFFSISNLDLHGIQNFDSILRRNPCHAGLARPQEAQDPHHSRISRKSQPQKKRIRFKYEFQKLANSVWFVSYFTLLKYPCRINKSKLSMDTPTCQESKDLRPPGRNPLSFGSPSRLYIAGVRCGGWVLPLP